MTRSVAAARGVRALALVGLLAGALAVGWPRVGHGADQSCAPHGTVRDVHGDPVGGITVRLARGSEVLTTATDEFGRYTLGSADALVDYEGTLPDALLVQLLPRSERAASPGFEVVYRDALPTLQSDPISAADADCRRDFDMASLPSSYRSSGPERALWPDIIEIYQHADDAYALAEEFGFWTGRDSRLRIYAWCDDPALGCIGSTNGLGDLAGFVGNRSNGPTLGGNPYVVFGPSTSALTNQGSPDNREYHELGHAVQHELLGQALPAHPHNSPHGGYYRNPSTADSWVEGFATFFSMMVSKHVRLDPHPERYLLYGAEYDLEVDHNAWEWDGWWEEFSVAGLLLDFEDGDDDYRFREAPRGLTAHPPEMRRAGSDLFVTGTITNDSSERVDFGSVVVEMVDRDGAAVFRTTAPTSPRSIQPGDTATYLVPLPPRLEFDRARVSTDPIALVDDDPIDRTLLELLSVIQAYRSDHPSSNGRLFDVSELYSALADAFGGTDRDRNGIDDVDQVFAAHGFFADLDGDRHRGRATTEVVGLTSHPATHDYPEMIPREQAPVAPEAILTLDSGGIATHVSVHVAYEPPLTSRGYAYRMDVGEGGEVVLAAPPPGLPATITILAHADGHLPAVAARLDSQDLWSGWASAPGQSLAPLEVAMEPGAPTGHELGLPERQDRRVLWLSAATAVIGMMTAAGYGWAFWSSNRRDGR